MVAKFFTTHPATVGENYWQHLGHSLSFAGAMLAGAAACLVHALVPALFEKSGSRIVTRLHDRMVRNRTQPGIPQDN